jgi:hypothetical protein
VNCNPNCNPEPSSHTGVVSPILRTGLVARWWQVSSRRAAALRPRAARPGAKHPMIAPEVAFIPTINGKTAVPRRDGNVPSYRVRSGESLMMRVTMIVPEHVTVTALWFGISTGTWSCGPRGRPVGMDPILAHYQQPLSAGSHTFGLRWDVPKHRSGASVYLSYAWSSPQPPARVAGPIATLILT